MKKKVKLMENEYQEIYNIFKKLALIDNIPPYKKFKKNLDIFFKLTLDAYVGNMGSKSKAFSKWAEFIGSRDVAIHYLRAVDFWHAYT